LVAVLLVPFVNVLYGILRFILVVERRELRPGGIFAHLPRPKSLPRFGFVLNFLPGGPERLLRELSSDGRGQVFAPLVVSGGDFAGDTLVHVFDADGVREMLTRTDVFVKQPASYDVLTPLLGNGLVLSAGDLWRRQRKLLTPMFHFQRLRAYAPLENEESQRLVDTLAARRGADTEIVPLLATCMQRIVMRAVFGERFDIEQMSQLWSQVNDCFKIFIAAVSFLPRCIAPLVPGRVRRTFACLKQVRDIIGAAVDRARSETGDCDDMVGQMARLDIDRELIIDECVTFMFAGRDTVSHAMGFAIYFLVRHPEVQEQLLAEAESVGTPIDDDARRRRLAQAARRRDPRGAALETAAAVAQSHGGGRRGRRLVRTALPEGVDGGGGRHRRAVVERLLGRGFARIPTESLVRRGAKDAASVRVDSVQCIDALVHRHEAGAERHIGDIGTHCASISNRGRCRQC
jgi:cytochrome P450